MQFSLILSTSAAALMKGNSRLRIKNQARGGKNYIAVRPSFRCKKTNHMVRVVEQEVGETKITAAHFSEAVLKAAGCPELAHGQRYMRDVGYGWYLLEEIPEGADVADLDLVELIEFCGPEGSDDEGDASSDTDGDTKAETADDAKAEKQETEEVKGAVDFKDFKFPSMAPVGMPADTEEVKATTGDSAIAHTEHEKVAEETTATSETAPETAVDA